MPLCQRMLVPMSGPQPAPMGVPWHTNRQEHDVDASVADNI